VNGTHRDRAGAERGRTLGRRRGAGTESAPVRREEVAVVVDGALPPTRWTPHSAAPHSTAPHSTAPQAQPPQPAPADPPLRTRQDAVELSGSGGVAASPWLERVSQVAGGGRGGASGTLGLDVVV
jgi:hypothetical protein